MNAGRLSHRVTIQGQTSTSDGRGGETTTWTNLAIVWASVDPVSSRDRYYNAQSGLLATHTVRMRYTSVLTAGCRLLHGSRVLTITGITNPSERNRELVVACVEEQTP